VQASSSDAQNASPDKILEKFLREELTRATIIGPPPRPRDADGEPSWIARFDACANLSDDECKQLRRDRREPGLVPKDRREAHEFLSTFFSDGVGEQLLGVPGLSTDSARPPVSPR